MYLVSLSYEENQHTAKRWAIGKVDFGPINLVVGKNSSGKTRLVNVINSLALLTAGRVAQMFDTGKWDSELARPKGQATEKYSYSIGVVNKHIESEKLLINERTQINRRVDGVVSMLRKNGKPITYKLPTEQLAAVVRRDELQHPFLEPLHAWGRDLCLYRFGTDFGKSNISIFGRDITDFSNTNQQISAQVDNPSLVFQATMNKFGSQYKDRILHDLDIMGYPCNDILLVAPPNIIINGSPAVVLALKEKSLEGATYQHEMSQGLYRALAILIQINANILWAQSRKVGRELQLGDSPMIIIDDIGEGLDYARSKALVEILIEKCLAANVQLLMTSNDRFVMNEVPLEYWIVLDRSGSNVKSFNYNNSKSKFDEFKYIGLNNFDFFSGKYFME